VDRRVFRELLSARYGLLPGRLPGSGGYLGRKVFMAFSARSCRNERGGKIYMGPMIPCAAVLATLLVIGGVELNPGPVENIVQVLCSGCERNLKSGTQYESCGR
jgi:hypothetical protein